MRPFIHTLYEENKRSINTFGYVMRIKVVLPSFIEFYRVCVSRGSSLVHLKPMVWILYGLAVIDGFQKIFFIWKEIWTNYAFLFTLGWQLYYPPDSHLGHICSLTAYVLSYILRVNKTYEIVGF